MEVHIQGTANSQSDCSLVKLGARKVYERNRMLWMALAELESLGKGGGVSGYLIRKKSTELTICFSFEFQRTFAQNLVTNQNYKGLAWRLYSCTRQATELPASGVALELKMNFLALAVSRVLEVFPMALNIYSQNTSMREQFHFVSCAGVNSLKALVCL